MEKTPNRERLEILRLLPEQIVRSMTREEIEAFLFQEEWPESLKEKLKDYLEDF